MNWLKDIFYLKPLATVFLVGAAYVTAHIILYPKAAKKAEKALLENGLKQISLNMFGRYLNKTSCSCMQSMFDGGRFAPMIDSVVSGRHENFTVTIFSFGLPTGRTGTWQTVIHLRHDPPSWLPMFSIIDEVVGKKMSSLLKCEHSQSSPLIDPNFIQRCEEAKQLQESLSQKPVIDGRRIVVDSTGEDLFYYRTAECIEPSELKGFIERAITIWQMINGGSIDLNIFKENYNQKIMKLNFLAKTLLMLSPGVFLIIAVGYGSPQIAAYMLAVFGTIILIAKLTAMRRLATLTTKGQRRK